MLLNDGKFFHSSSIVQITLFQRIQIQDKSYELGLRSDF
jgi:hypothetical protein